MKSILAFSMVYVFSPLLVAGEQIQLKDVTVYSSITVRGGETRAERYNVLNVYLFRAKLADGSSVKGRMDCGDTGTPNDVATLTLKTQSVEETFKMSEENIHSFPVA